MSALVLLDQYGGIGGGQVVLVELAERVARRVPCRALVPAGPLADALAALPGVQVQAWEPRLRPGALAALLRVVRGADAVLLVNGQRPLLPALAAKAVRALARRRTHVVFVAHSRPGTALRRAVLRHASAWCDTRVLVARCLRGAVRGPVSDVALGVRPRDLPEGDTWTALHPDARVKALGRDDPVKGLDLLPLAVQHLQRRGTARASFALALSAPLESSGSAAPTGDGPVVRVGPRRMDWVEPDDVLVVPSRSEAACLTAQEAMARGAVVVASAVGDVPDFVRDGETGFLFPAGDAAALADALERALALPAPQRQALRREARRAVEERSGWYEAVDDLLVGLAGTARG